MNEYKIDLSFGSTGARNYRKHWFWRPTLSYGRVPFDGVTIRQLGVRLPFLWFSIWASRRKRAAAA